MDDRPAATQPSAAGAVASGCELVTPPSQTEPGCLCFVSLLLSWPLWQPSLAAEARGASLPLRARHRPTRFIGGRKDNVAFYVKSLQSDGSCQFTLMSPTAKYLVELDESRAGTLPSAAAAITQSATEKLLARGFLSSRRLSAAPTS
uniref:Curli production assembly/transport component CsgE n=1 Tax=Macrostomum lignano TaxID=282301 RepID=A0A1I8FLX2_9PLAT